MWPRFELTGLVFCSAFELTGFAFALPGVAEHQVSQLKGYAPYGSTEYTTAKLGGWTDEQLNPQPVSGADPTSNNRNFPVKPVACV